MTALDLCKSCTPFLTSIPVHWGRERLRWFIRDLTQGWSPEAEDREPADGEWGVLKLNAVQRGKFNIAAVKTVPPELEVPESLQVRPGDVLVTRANTPGQVGDVCFVTKARPRVILSDLIYRVRLHEDRIDGRFLVYFLLCPMGRRQIESDARGTSNSMVKISQEHIADWWIPVPPLAQQRLIANYLDRETARIDALIAAKERVLALLAEKRRVLITRAVTRGVDPYAPLRDSGIPWLGEIPAHWRRAQLRRFIQFITSGSRGWAEHYSDSGALFVRMGNLTRDSVRLDLSDVQYVEPPEGAEGERTRVRLGDLLFSITAYLGSIALVDHDIEEAYVNQHIALVRLDQSRGLLAQYAAYVALSNVGQTQLVAQSYGGTKTQLALDDVRELWFPVPSADEQAAIVEFVEASLATLDRLRSVAEATVRLLKERRSALIAAAVSGQIDVGNAA